MQAQAEIKRVGQSGQISIGRELAGKLLRVEHLVVSQKIRALAYREGAFLRFISLHPDHDSAYR